METGDRSKQISPVNFAELINKVDIARRCSPQTCSPTLLPLGVVSITVAPTGRCNARIIDGRGDVEDSGPITWPRRKSASGRSRRRPASWSLEGDDMDEWLRMLRGFRRWDIVKGELPRPDRAVQLSSIPVGPTITEAREMVLSLMDRDPYAALVALMLSAGCAGLPRPVSETSLVTTAPNATATGVPPDVAGQYWKRDQSREIKFGPAGIVSIIERAGPPDQESPKAAAL